MNTTTKQQYQTITQEIEILLSVDFGKMSLEELQAHESKYRAYISEHEDRPSWTKEQYKAWQFMYFRITQEKNKHDAAKIGDIFHTSWGYDQTNSEFYKIVSISKTGKTCEVVRIAGEFIGDKETINRNMSGQMVPNPDKIINPTPCKVKIEREHSANPWSGKSEQIGEIQLRGSVYYTDSEKHLTNLYRVKGPVSVSWYA